MARIAGPRGLSLADRMLGCTGICQMRLRAPVAQTNPADWTRPQAASVPDARCRRQHSRPGRQPRDAQSEACGPDRKPVRPARRIASRSTGRPSWPVW